MPSHSNGSQKSDAHYIFILFALIFVVLFFAFLIYFVYGQRQFASREDTSDTILQTIEKKNSPQIPDLENKNATELAPVSTTNPTPSVIPSPTFDPTRYNPRTLDTIGLHGRQLLDKYFSAIQS